MRPIKPPYIELGLQKTEKYILFLVVFLSAIVNLSPIYNSGNVRYMVALMAAISLCRPITGFYFIAFTQHFPELGGAWNPAQIGVMVWVPLCVLQFPRLRFRGLHALLLLVPVLLWGSVIMQRMPLSLTLPLGNYEKSIIFALMACQLANTSEGQYLKCLLGLSLGAFSVTFSYWMNIIGLPVALDEGAFRGGFERVGSAGTDSVMVWVGILMGLAGILGIAMTSMMRLPGTRQTVLMQRLVFLALLFSVPPLFASMTTAAFLGYGIIVGVYIAVILRQPGSRRLLKPLLLVAVILGLVVATNQFGMLDRFVAMFSWYGGNIDGGDTLGTRTGVWDYAIALISQNPVLGIPKNLDIGGFMAHNVFFDYAIHAGIPGALLYSIFIFYPLVKLLSKPGFPLNAAFLMWYLIVFIFLFILSFPHYKTVWAFWMLASVVVNDSARIRRDDRRAFDRHSL